MAYPQPVIQPFGAYWLDAKRQLVGSSTLAVQAMMAHYGIEVDPTSSLLADHIVTELEFRAYLTEQDAWTQETQHQLLDQH